MRLRDDYIADCQRGVERWNKVIAKTGVATSSSCRMSASIARSASSKDVKARRRARSSMTPRGASAASGSVADDDDFIASLMQPVTTPGEFAGWIAPPRIGIDNKPGDFEYVKIAA